MIRGIRAIRAGGGWCHARPYRLGGRKNHDRGCYGCVFPRSFFTFRRETTWKSCTADAPNVESVGGRYQFDLVRTTSTGKIGIT